MPVYSPTRFPADLDAREFVGQLERELTARRLIVARSDACEQRVTITVVVHRDSDFARTGDRFHIGWRAGHGWAWVLCLGGDPQRPITGTLAVPADAEPADIARAAASLLAVGCWAPGSGPVLCDR
jgi:hypothetical protein